MKNFIMAFLLGGISLTLSAQTPKWTPPAGYIEWQWQISSPPASILPGLTLYDIDYFDNDAAMVSRIHAAGEHAICYINVGAWESWRPDARNFPASVIGAGLDGWPGENWLDVRQLGILQPLMEARIAGCAAQGYDALEPDNVDGYQNSPGFPITSGNQLAYNQMIAGLAHRYGLSVALKNDIDQVRQLAPYFDFALNEECNRYRECGAYSAFTSAKKQVLQVEYSQDTTKFCPADGAARFSGMKKTLALTASRRPCK